jgi:hypothetical protein
MNPKPVNIVAIIVENCMYSIFTPLLFDRLGLVFALHFDQVAQPAAFDGAVTKELA